MKVKIIELAKDEGLSTVVEVNKSLYEAMDCIGYTTKTFVGDILDGLCCTNGNVLSDSVKYRDDYV